MKAEEELYELWKTFENYIDRAWILLNDISISLDTHSYLYAALDLRLSIEKLLSMLLSIVSERELTKKQKSLYRVKDFIQEMQKENSDYEKDLKTKINNHLSDSDQKNVEIPDIKKLNELYGILGNLLHLGDSSDNYIAENTKLERIEEIVLSSYEYLVQFRNLNLEEISIPAAPDPIVPTSFSAPGW